jgi:FkbM family methyltransferase
MAGGSRRLGSRLLGLAHYLQHGPAAVIYPNPRFDPHRHSARVRDFHESNRYHHLLDFDLTEESIVFDVGGYNGDYAANILCRYLSTVHIFEVVPAYCRNMRHRFLRNPRIQVHEVGLAGRTREESLFPAEAGSSIFLDRTGVGERISIRLVQADEFIRSLRLGHIDLMKLNIEGGEYELLEHLLQAGWAERIQNICVQFHEETVPDASARMYAIQKTLARTHRLTFQFEFVWENWQRK